MRGRSSSSNSSYSSSSSSNSSSSYSSQSSSESSRTSSEESKIVIEEPKKELKTFIEVRNLTRNINEKHLQEIFSNFGQIDKIFMNRDNRKVNQRAIIGFKTEDDYQNMIKHMNRGLIDGQEIILNIIEKTEDEVNALIWPKCNSAASNSNRKERTQRSRRRSRSRSHSR